MTSQAPTSTSPRCSSGGVAMPSTMSVARSSVAVDDRQSLSPPATEALSSATTTLLASHPSSPESSGKRVAVSSSGVGLSASSQENSSWVVNTPERRPNRFGGVPVDVSQSAAATADFAMTSGFSSKTGQQSRRWDESEHAPLDSLQKLLRSVEASTGRSTAPRQDGVAGSSVSRRQSFSRYGSEIDDGRNGGSSTVSARKSVKRTIASCLGSALRGANGGGSSSKSAEANLMSPPSALDLKPKSARRKKTDKWP